MGGCLRLFSAGSEGNHIFHRVGSQGQSWLDGQQGKTSANNTFSRVSLTVYAMRAVGKTAVECRPPLGALSPSLREDDRRPLTGQLGRPRASRRNVVLSLSLLSLLLSSLCLYFLALAILHIRVGLAHDSMHLDIGFETNSCRHFYVCGYEDQILHFVSRQLGPPRAFRRRESERFARATTLAHLWATLPPTLF